MKTVIIFLVGLFILVSTNAQTEITPQVLQKLKKDIEAQVPAIKKKLEKEKTNAVIIEFTIDTFRIEKLLDEKIGLDVAEYSMRDATYAAADSYDSLLNKYYKKLLGILKGDDKKILQQAQKNWLAYRDSETNLVGTISKDEYSGGGSMQHLTESSLFLNIIRSRVLAIFDHYTRGTQVY